MKQLRFLLTVLAFTAMSFSTTASSIDVTTTKMETAVANAAAKRFDPILWYAEIDETGGMQVFFADYSAEWGNSHQPIHTTWDVYGYWGVPRIMRHFLVNIDLNFDGNDGAGNVYYRANTTPGSYLPASLVPSGWTLSSTSL